MEQALPDANCALCRSSMDPAALSLWTQATTATAMSCTLRGALSPSVYMLQQLSMKSSLCMRLYPNSCHPA